MYRCLARGKTRIVLALVIATILAVSGFLTGCGKKINPGDVTLTYWCNLAATASGIMTSYTDTEWNRVMFEKTGVKVNFLHPVFGQEKEQLNVMIASGDLTDMIESAFIQYTGGVVKAHEDGLILDITNLQKKHAPNLMKLYDNYPDLYMEMADEEGRIFQTPLIKGHDSLRTFQGPALRKDWLKKLNLPEPETIEDWYNVLTKFKKELKVKVPLLVVLNDLRVPGFITAFGITSAYFVEDGKVKYGPIDPRFKDYMKEMAKWYKEGLIYPDFALKKDAKKMDAMIMGDEAGAAILMANSGISRYMSLMENKNPEFFFGAVQYPSLVKGEAPRFLQREGLVNNSGCVAITSSCEYPELALKYLDYGYSKEGHMLMNFGIEGVSYEIIDGEPKYTDLIMNNPDGIPRAAISYQYFRVAGPGPYVQDSRKNKQGRFNEKENVDIWAKFTKEAVEAKSEVHGILTADETAATSSKQLEVNTYGDEMFIKFVMGSVDVEKEFDNYVARMEQMGIKDIIAIKQAAYDRFVKRYPDVNNPKTYSVEDIFWK
ncbi:MAG: Lipoprotein LipO precursor [Firmicutes bacterium ADurb.Bin193]|nr:MAG: Lipoprotein LipO precursor [Firmicutes bacterium ADurb.Bin193]